MSETPRYELDPEGKLRQAQNGQLSYWMAMEEISDRLEDLLAEMHYRRLTEDEEVVLGNLTEAYYPGIWNARSAGEIDAAKAGRILAEAQEAGADLDEDTRSYLWTQGTFHPALMLRAFLRERQSAT